MAVSAQQICNLYESGLSLSAVSRRSGKSVYLIRRALDQNNIKVRPPGNQRIDVSEPYAMVHLGAKIPQAYREALDASPGGISVGVRNAIGQWIVSDKSTVSFTKEEVVEILAAVSQSDSEHMKGIKQKIRDFLEGKNDL